MADSGFAELDAMIDRLKALGGLAEDAAREAAPLVDAEIKRTAAAAETPMGAPWPAKKGGGRALAHAAEHITTSAQGARVLVTLTGVDVFHHRGLGHKPIRQIIPDGASVSPALWAAVLRGAKIAFTKITGAST